MHTGKSLDCHEQNFKDNSDESLGRKEANCRENLNLLREYLIKHEQDVGRNMDNKDQDGNEEHVIENCRRSDPYHKVAKNSGRTVSMF